MYENPVQQIEFYRITLQQLLFYGTVWVLGALSTAARTFREGERVNYFDVFCFSCSAGFLSLSCVSILVYCNAFGSKSAWPYLGVSPLIGFLSEKGRDALAQGLVERIFAGLKAIVNTKDQDK